MNIDGADAVKRHREGLLMSRWLLLGGDKKVLELESGGDCTTL